MATGFRCLFSEYRDCCGVMATEGHHSVSPSGECSDASLCGGYQRASRIDQVEFVCSDGNGVGVNPCGFVSNL